MHFFLVLLDSILWMDSRLRRTLIRRFAYNSSREKNKNKNNNNNCVANVYWPLVVFWQNYMQPLRACQYTYAICCVAYAAFIVNHCKPFNLLAPCYCGCSSKCHCCAASYFVSLMRFFLQTFRLWYTASDRAAEEEAAIQQRVQEYSSTLQKGICFDMFWIIDNPRQTT